MRVVVLEKGHLSHHELLSVLFVPLAVGVFSHFFRFVRHRVFRLGCGDGTGWGVPEARCFFSAGVFVFDIIYLHKNDDNVIVAFLQRGAILATELKNNSAKLAKWTAQSILSGADQMKIGLVLATATAALLTAACFVF